MPQSNNIQNLEPQIIWKYFYEISQIPRASGNEGKISAYIVEFCKMHKLRYKIDKTGNVVVFKNGDKSKINQPAVILQSHLDMVCEKNSTSAHNFDTDPIEPIIDNGWVKAKETTLGADNGIGVAAQLAILASTDIEHPPLECLFTIEEEIGLLGAFGLDDKILKGKYLINLDSEDEGEIFIGCAGGLDTRIGYFFKTRPLKANYTTYQINVSGLTGGHSGDDIEKGLANANKILVRFLYNINQIIPIKVSEIDGGNLSNAIPREAAAVVSVKLKHEEVFLNYFNEFIALIKNEYHKTEPNIILNFESVINPEKTITRKSFNPILLALHSCPNGVIEMSQEMDNLVETSTNLASIKTNNNIIEIVTSQRSSLKSRKDEIASRINAVFSLANANVNHESSYPGWQPNANSYVLKVANNSYQQLFNCKPKVRAIHAGLECGAILETYPELDIVSFGPTIKGAHSPDERLKVGTVDKFWKLLLEVLKKIGG